MTPQPITYEQPNPEGNIVLPSTPPFDGKPILIKLAAGWVEAWWDNGYAIEDQNGKDYRGWNWCCLDDQFTAELDDATEWCPLP